MDKRQLRSRSVGSPSPKAIRGCLDRDLVSQVREVLRAREHAFEQLEHAVVAITEPTFFESFERLINKLPLALSVELATIRLADSKAEFHLVAAVGFSANEIRVRALSPLDLGSIREMQSKAGLRRHAIVHGLRWVDVSWIGPASDPIGTLLVATRTERRPSPDEHALLPSLAETLDNRLRRHAREPETLRKCALEVARSFEANEPVAADEVVAKLRPRERGILGLYADGLSTSEVAALLVISPHTVRTHVKHALRTLGLRTREEAAKLVRTSHTLLCL